MRLSDDKVIKFIGLAKAIALFSKDPSTKVGALAIDSDGILLAMGFNGFPRGVEDTPERYGDREVKYALVSHAEQNLVAQAARVGHPLKGSTVFLSGLYPCSSCAKSLIQAGVTRIYTPRPELSERWRTDAEWSKLMFDEAGVEIIYVGGFIVETESEGGEI